MTIQEVIKRAVEEGWNDRLYRVDTGNTDVWTHSTSMLLDPIFWQALGKSMGWDMATEIKFSAQHVLNEKTIHLYTEKISIWEWYWHDFISHLASGKSIEEYFNKL